jgi:ubiquinone/menaquinone biosynthesis C-methylase UbiE
LGLENEWKRIIKDYASPTVIKNDLLTPFFLSKKFAEPVLDVGCGDGFFAKPLSKRFRVIGIDAHDFAFQEFEYIKCDAAKIPLQDSSAGDVLLINVLSCIDTASKRVKILKEIKRTKRREAAAYVVNTPQDFIEKDIDSPLLRVKRLSKNKVQIDVLKTDGKWNSFPDYVIKDAEFEKYAKKAGLEIAETKLFVHPKLGFPVYKLWVLK